MTSQYILQTNRLTLRKLTTDDMEFIVELLNTPGWLQFIGDRNVHNRDQAIAYLENGPFKSYQQHGFGLWLVADKTDGRPIGMCGLLVRDQLETPDIGYAFLPAFQGRGYAFESVSAVLIYAKNQLGIERVSAITLPDNLRSINVLTKSGLKFKSEFSFHGNAEILHLYRNF